MHRRPRYPADKYLHNTKNQESNPLLAQPKQHQHPFPFFSVASAFSEAQCTILERLFLRADDWRHQDGEFYRCSFLDVTEAISPEFLAELLIRIRELTGLPLVDHMHVTAQRMQPGQVIGLHSDRPLLGYEIARLVVQLNQGWQAEHGGVLELFASPVGKAVSRFNPDYNSAFGFLLHADSYHAVTEVTIPRQTIVFNFWHAANTPELAACVQALLAQLNFAEFPKELNPIASQAEASLPEDLTFRAGTAALALQRWGYDTATVVAGYQHSAGLLPVNPEDPETYAAVLLADWVAYLYREAFDLARWKNLQGELKGLEKFTRLQTMGQLCFPVQSAHT
jgi:2OG-Fe(II) oxygenase superfamily